MLKTRDYCILREFESCKYMLSQSMSVSLSISVCLSVCLSLSLSSIGPSFVSTCTLLLNQTETFRKCLSCLVNESSI